MRLYGGSFCVEMKSHDGNSSSFQLDDNVTYLFLFTVIYFVSFSQEFRFFTWGEYVRLVTATELVRGGQEDARQLVVTC